MNRQHTAIRTAALALLVGLSVAGCGRLSGGAGQTATQPGSQPVAQDTEQPTEQPAAQATDEATVQPQPSATFAWPATDPLAGTLDQIDQLLQDTGNSLNQSQPTSEGD